MQITTVGSCLQYFFTLHSCHSHYLHLIHTFLIRNTQCSCIKNFSNSKTCVYFMEGKMLMYEMFV